MERAVPGSTARARAIAACAADRAAGHLHAALFYLPLAGRSRARADVRAVRAHGRLLSALRDGLQLLGRGLGRIHRAVRHGGADRDGDGDLLERSGRAEENREGTIDAPGPARGSDGRRGAEIAAESDDGLDGRRGATADYVERERGRGGDEAFGHTGAGRDGFVAHPRVDRHARDFLLAARTRSAARRDDGATDGVNRQGWNGAGQGNHCIEWTLRQLLSASSWRRFMLIKEYGMDLGRLACRAGSVMGGGGDD